MLAGNPRVLLVDEPTQSVDVGARAEMDRVIREAARSGVAVILVSSDQQEVAGLSDRVAIFSRGRVVEMLSGDRVTEDNITSSVLKSTVQRDKHHRTVGAFWKWAAGNSAPLIMVAAAILLLGAVAGHWNPFSLSPRSLSNMMTLTATLAITMFAQVGIGDPRAGISYTLGSIAAVVIGGASLFGGRGSFIGSLLGAIFITQVNSVTVFLRLSQEWQQYLLGFLILASVALYSKSREKVVEA